MTAALSDVSLEIYPGEVHAIVGENGAGKSTLIKIMTGVYQPDSGELFSEGKLVTLGTTKDAFRRMEQLWLRVVTTKRCDCGMSRLGRRRRDLKNIQVGYVA